MFRRHPTLLPLLLLLLLPVMAVADTNADAQIMQGIVESYREAAQPWAEMMLGYANTLFLSLALIELVWLGALLALNHEELQSFMSQFIRSLMVILFFYSLLQMADQWVPMLITMFTHAGQTATGLGALNPSEVFGRGLDLAGHTAATVAKTGASIAWNSINPFDSGSSGFATAFAMILLAVPAAIIILLSFSILAGQLMIALIESYLVISAGLLFLGFGGSRWTSSYTSKLISYAMSTGVKLFMIYLIAGLALETSHSWVAQIEALADQEGNGAHSLMAFIGSSLALAFVAVKIPELAAGILGGQPAMSFSEFRSTTKALYHDTREAIDETKEALVEGTRQTAGLADSMVTVGVRNTFSGVAREQWHQFSGQSYSRDGTTIGGRANRLIRAEQNIPAPKIEAGRLSPFLNEFRTQVTGSTEIIENSFFGNVANQLDGRKGATGDGRFKD